MTAPAFPMPTEQDTEVSYRDRLLDWFLAIDSPNTAGLRQAEWEHLCSLAGVDPGPPLSFED